jgi:hypothetical protein
MPYDTLPMRVRACETTEAGHLVGPIVYLVARLGLATLLWMTFPGVLWVGGMPWEITPWHALLFLVPGTAQGEMGVVSAGVALFVVWIVAQSVLSPGSTTTRNSASCRRLCSTS